MGEEIDWDKEFKEAMEAEREYYAKIARQNTRTLNAIEKQLGKKYHQAVIDCIMESEGHGLYELTKTPGGHKQGEDWGEFDHIYVDQWQDGGMSGDDFAGDIWIPLKKDLYLKVTYQM